VRTYYELLKVSPASDTAAIRNAYRALMRRYHPDRFPGDKIYAARMSQSLNEAYAVLSDPARRVAYDAKLAADPAKIFRSKLGASQPGRSRRRTPPKTRKMAVSALPRETKPATKPGALRAVPVSAASLLLLGAFYFLLNGEAAVPLPGEEVAAASDIAETNLPKRASLEITACCESTVNDGTAVATEEEITGPGPGEGLVVRSVAGDAERSNVAALKAREELASNKVSNARSSSAPVARATAAAVASSQSFAVKDKPVVTGASSSPAAEAGSSAPAPQRPAVRNAVIMSQQARADLASEVNRQLQSCANRQASPGSGANRIVTAINLRLNRDGSFARRPTVLRQIGLDDDNRHFAERVAELALAEFARCSSVKGLPDELYDVPNGWRSVTFNYRFP
jgi:hypothetical protein